MKKVLLISIILTATLQLAAQRDTARIKTDSLPARFYMLQKVERSGETLPEIEIKEVTIVARKKNVSPFAGGKYARTIYNIKVVYPYALIVRNKLEQVNGELQKMSGEKERKEYIRNFEKQVFKDYEGDMRDLTITQGRILIKLIDRETQITSYDLIKEYRGKITAAFWQGIARIFGTNLKDEYDPYGEDAAIEMILQEIEAGRL